MKTGRIKIELTVIWACVFGVYCCSALEAAKGNSAVCEAGSNQVSTATSDVNAVTEENSSMDGRAQHRDIAELSRLGTEEARDELLEIALGHYETGGTQWAANSYVRSLQDKCQARRLLVSKNLAIQMTGLRALEGCEIDEQLWDKLFGFIKSDNLYLRQAAVSVIDAEPHPRNSTLQNKAKAIIDSMAASDIKEIMEESPNISHRAIGTLGGITTEEARDRLLEIALGHHGARWTEWAASNYVKSLPDKSQARALLESSDPKIQHVALLALRGGEIDSEMLEDLKQILEAGNLNLRRAAASIIRQAPPHPYGREVAAALIDSAQTVATVPRADNRLAFATRGPLWTDAGYAYREIISALSGSKDIDTEIMKELLSTTTDHARDCIVIALSRGGDSSVKTQLREIAEKSKYPALRSSAVGAFSVVGTKRDIDFLERIAATDSFEVEPTAQQVINMEALGQPVVDKLYPIRSEAESIITRISRNNDN